MSTSKIGSRKAPVRTGTRHLSALAGALLASLALLLCIAPTASALPTNFFGFQHSGFYPESEPDMEAVARSGAKYWRVPFDCDTSFTKLDKRVELAWKHGISIIAQLSECNGSVQYPKYDYKNPSTAWKNWETWLWELVQRYGYPNSGENGTFWDGKSNPKPISVWELWNEPNRGLFNPGGTEAQPEEYAKFLKRSSSALVEAQGTSSISVLMGGLITLPSKCVVEFEAERCNLNVRQFLEGTAEVSETGSKFNGMGSHPYAFGSGSAATVAANIGQARIDLTEVYSASKSLWITEVGWPVAPEAPVDPGHERVSAEEQASLMDWLFDWVEAEQSSLNIQSLIFYFYRDYNWNGKWDSYSGLRKDASHTFTETNFRPAWYTYQEHTGAASWPVKPGTTTDSATGVSYRKATLRGSVDPNGLSTEYKFEWGESDSYGNSTETKSEWEDKSFSHSKELPTPTLTPNTTYHYRITGTNENAETGNGSDETFKTLAAKPIITAVDSGTPYVEEETGKAELKGEINPNGFGTTYHFEWGDQKEFKAEELNNSTPEVEMEYTGYDEAKPVEQTIEGLKGNTTYHYRLVAENSEGETTGENTFETPDWRPGVTTSGATEVLWSEATLHGIVNPKGFATTYHFEYGFTTEYGSKVPIPSEAIGSGDTGVSVSQELTDLKKAWTYHFRVTATNTEGTSYGEDLKFKTLPYKTSLCKLKEKYCEASDRYPVGTLLQANSDEATISLAPSEEVSCTESSLEGSTNAATGEQLPIEIEAWTLGGCVGPSESSCTVTTPGVPYAGTLTQAISFGKFGTVGVLAIDEPGWHVECGEGGSVVQCDYAFEKDVAFVDGDPAEMFAEGALDGSGEGCPEGEPKLTATFYTVDSPEPLYLAEPRFKPVVPVETVLCEEAPDSESGECEEGLAYPKELRLIADSGDVTLDPGYDDKVVACGLSRLEADSLAESGKPLPLEVDTWSFEGCFGSGSTFGTCSVDAGPMPLDASITGVGGSQGGEDGSLAIAQPEWHFECSGGAEGPDLDCTYRLEESELSGEMAAGEAVEVRFQEASLEEVEGECPGSAPTISANFTISQPLPLYVIDLTAEATVLCEEAEESCPAEAQYLVSTPLKSSAADATLEIENGFFGLDAEVICGESDLNGETAARAGDPLLIEFDTWSLSDCEDSLEIGRGCTVSVQNSPYVGSLTWTEGVDGALGFASSGEGEPSLHVECLDENPVTPDIDCTYSFEPELELEGGEAAQISFAEEPMSEGESGKCPGSAPAFSAAYSVEAPQPLFVALSE